MKFCACKYGKCAAVCKRPEERKIFEYIFQTLKVDIYLCEHVAYKIQLMNERWIVLEDLGNVIKGKLGFYIIDPFSGIPIYLNKDNTKLICADDIATTCTDKDPYVYRGIKLT